LSSGVARVFNHEPLFPFRRTCYYSDRVACAGLPAARSCEPRQARKGAAVTMDAGAGTRTVWAAFFLSPAFVF